jgi:subtilisin family serine protease
VPGEVLVRFRSGIGQQTRASALGQVGATVKERLPVRGLRLVKVDRTRSAREAAAELDEQRGVRYAEPNYIYRIQATPNDPRLDQLWGLHNTGQDVDGTSGIPDADIDAPEAWETAAGSSDVTVAVVDTGIAYGHPDLAPNIRTNPGETGGGKESNGIDDDANGLIDDWRGWDFYRSDNDPDDLNGHGSHVAGTIGARGDDGYGAVGVNWQVGLMPLRVCSARGSCFASDIASAFAYAGAEGAEVVNVSLGGSSFSYAISDSIADAPETLFAVAAGNVSYDMDSQSSNRKQYPCGHKFPNIVCVAATTQDDELADFSSYGPSSVDLGAPGTNVLSTWPAYETVYSEGFEDDISSTWATDGTNNTWARTDEASASGSFSLTDSPSAPYVGGTDSFAYTTTPIDLNDREGCRLHYKMRLELGGDGPFPDSSAFFDVYGGTSSASRLDGWRVREPRPCPPALRGRGYGFLPPLPNEELSRSRGWGWRPRRRRRDPMPHLDLRWGRVRIPPGNIHGHPACRWRRCLALIAEARGVAERAEGRADRELRSDSRPGRQDGERRPAQSRRRSPGRPADYRDGP